METDHNYLKYFTMKQNSRLLDIGASCGEFGDEILDQLKSTDSHLLCVEAAPWCVERLANWINEKGYTNCSMLSAAVAGFEGYIPFNISSSYLTSSMNDLPSDQIGKWGDKIVRTDQVVALSLNALSNSFGPFDLVKMDVESAEVLILDGFYNPNRVNNFSIAAYHDYGDKKTWEIIIPRLKFLGYQVIHECLPYKNYSAVDMIYASRDGSIK